MISFFNNLASFPYSNGNGDGKMATGLLTRDLAINALLCFTISKRRKLSEKVLKGIILDFYSIDEVVTAKKRLISDVELFSADSTSFPRFADRAGDNRFEREVSDLLKILNLIDERNIGIKLPTYVTDDYEKMPSVKLDDGDLRYLLAKMDKMALTIQGLQATINSVHAMVSKPSATIRQPVNYNDTVPVIPAPQPTTSTTTVITDASSCWSRPLTSTTKQHDVPSVAASMNQPSYSLNALSQSAVQPSADLRSSWADAPGSYTGTSTGDSCNELDGFQFQGRKRRRTRTHSNVPRGQPGGQPSAATYLATEERVPSMYIQGQSTLLPGGARPKTTTDEQSKLAPAAVFGRHFKKPLIVGKSSKIVGINGIEVNNGVPTVSAARPFKSIYCVDNVSASCSEHDLAEFVTGLGVRVLSCFEVLSRFSRGQKKRQTDNMQPYIPCSKAFRLCINRADNDLLLRADAWPNDITLSKWYFVKEANAKNVNGVTNSESVMQTSARGNNVDISMEATGNRKRDLTPVLTHKDKDDLNADIASVHTSNMFEVLQSSMIEDHLATDTDNDATIIDANISTMVASGGPLAAGTPNTSSQNGIV